MNTAKILFFCFTILSINAKAQITPATNYDLKYHHLTFKVDPAKYYITGNVVTYFSPIEDNVKSISFDLSTSLEVDSVIYKKKQVTFHHQNNKLGIDFPSVIDKNSIDSVSIFYQGEPDNSNGFGSFITDKHNRTPIMWTLSEPYGAKDWWPCKQDLYDKADSIDLVVIHPNKYKAAGNGILLSETEKDGLTYTHWKHRHPITAYLVAFAVTNYTAYSDYVPLNANDSIEILNYVYPESYESAKKQTPATIKIMQLYNKLFITYPYADEKYGHAQFGWGGGMEHQTMSFMVNFSFDLIAHELAHQWFGDYITCDSWKNIWINEGFATYCESLCHEYGISNMNWSSYKKNQISYITSRPGGSLYVNDTTSDYSIFDGRLSYAKGGMVLHMLRNEVGDAAFFKGIKNYLNDPKLANAFASTENFQEHIEITSGKDLDYFFKDWVYGQGYPNYTVTWGQSDDNIGSLKISQTQSHRSVEFFELNVPIKFIGEGKDTTISFRNIENDQVFSWELDFKVNSIYLDPENWIITKNPVIQAINISDLEKQISIVPNPVDSSFNVKLNDSIKFNSVIIQDISGKEILNFGETDYKNEFSFNISQLNKGIYFVVLQHKNDRIAKKIIKD